jgi:hypothetical protein
LAPEEDDEFSSFMGGLDVPPVPVFAVGEFEELPDDD